MTCMKQEFCIHEKYCQRHIGQNFDSCILFSRNSKPMTNEEYLRSCTTEQLAEWLGDTFDLCGAGCSKCFIKELCFDEHNNKMPTELFVEWLKQPHTGGES